MKVKTTIETAKAGDWELFEDGELVSMKIDGGHPFQFTLQEAEKIRDTLYFICNSISTNKFEALGRQFCAPHSHPIPITSQDGIGSFVREGMQLSGSISYPDLSPISPPKNAGES